MARVAMVMTGIFTILISCFALMVGAYFLAAAGDKYLFLGASRLANMLVLMLVFVMVIATLLTIAERKWSAFMQDRVGPNRARLSIIPGLKNRPLAGIPHIITDVLKMLTKEDFRPAAANASKFLYNLAPMLAFAPVFALFAVVPCGPSLTLLGQRVDMVVATPDFGILWLFAIASLAVYGTSLAGWSSNNKFALLGGVRASSQMISYEVALGLSLVGMMIVFSSVSLPVLADGQAQYLWKGSLDLSGIGAGTLDLGLPAWGIFLQPVGFVLFFAAAFAETKRAPFDVPEGESEIIGYFVEYSGMKFGMFMISEFAEVVILSGVLVTLFFGGYHSPIGDEWLTQREVLREHTWLYGGLMGLIFWVKVIALIWVQMVIRWTFPRFRYDQIQTLGWKILLPAGLVNLFVTGALILWDPSLRTLGIVGLLEIGTVIALTASANARSSAAHADHDHGHGGHDAHGAHAAHPAAAPAHASH